MVSISQRVQSSTTETENQPFLSSELQPNIGGEGEAATLDLIIGHLPYSSYIPVTRGLQVDPQNWFMPSEGYDPTKDQHQVLKIQPFKSGGYEVTVTTQDLKRIAGLMDGARRTGAREPGQQKDNDVISSLNRSRRRIRHLIKSMGCDRLLTLTMREIDPDNYKTIDEWQAAWERFNRLCKKAGLALEYVAVLERHKKGNYHLHAAISGHVNIKTIRRFWYMCCGGRGNEKGSATPGQVDLSFKAGMSQHKRRAGCAKYVSKYVAKQAGYVEFNKKRYWSSRHKLLPVRRYILKATNASDMLLELSVMLTLDIAAVSLGSYQFNGFRDGNQTFGLWFSYDDEMALKPPF